MANDTGARVGWTLSTIDVAELSANLDEVLLSVRDYFRTVDVVRGGRIIARIAPPPMKIQTTHPDDVGKQKVTVSLEERERFKRLHAELSARLHELAPEPFDAVEEIRDQRSHGGHV